MDSPGPDLNQPVKKDGVLNTTILELLWETFKDLTYLTERRPGMVVRKQAAS